MFHPKEKDGAKTLVAAAGLDAHQVENGQWKTYTDRVEGGAGRACGGICGFVGDSDGRRSVRPGAVDDGSASQVKCPRSNSPTDTSAAS